MQLCLTKLSVIFYPYVISLDFFFYERIVAATSNVQGMSAKNDSLLQIEEIVRIYANSKYLDRNVRWVHFILAEYTSGNSVSGCSHVNPSSCSLVRRVQDLIKSFDPCSTYMLPMIATGFIALSPLSLVSTMVMWESSKWLGKNTMWSTGSREPRKHRRSFCDELCQLYHVIHIYYII